jgi:hypothetical protein
MPKLKDIEISLLSSIDEQPDGEISLSLLGTIYSETFGANGFKKFGFSKLKDLVESRASIEVFFRSGVFCCRRRHQVLEALSPRRHPPATNTVLVESLDKLESLGQKYPFNCKHADSEGTVIAVNCKGGPENLYLVQIATKDAVFVFDCVKLNTQRVSDFLRGMLLDERTTKLFHDLHNDAAALATIGNIEGLRGTLDTQLAMELLTGHLYMGFNDMLGQLDHPKHQSKQLMKGRMHDAELFARRPIDNAIFQNAIDDVHLLIDAQPKLFALLDDALEVGAQPMLFALNDDALEVVKQASDARALMAGKTGGARQIAFDVANSYDMASFELLQAARPDDMFQPAPLVVSNETDTLLGLLQNDITEQLQDRTDKLSDIVLDKGRRPLCWIQGERVLLGDNDRLVDDNDINTIVDSIGGFGTDNRAGVEKQLHRISAMRNRDAIITGLTMRVGRNVTGNSNMIADILYNNPSASILFLGEPGSGKTSK